jgi:hypothetical protein
MAEEEEKFRVALFSGTNFNNWKFRLEVVLDESNLLPYIESDITEIIAGVAEGAGQTNEIAEHKRKDKKCKSMIIRRIADSHLEYVKDKSSSYAVLGALKSTFERKSVATQLYLRRKLLTLKCENSEELDKHFLTFDNIVRELKATGATLEESDIVCHLLLTLPDSYSTVVTAIETMDAAKLNLELVKGRLLDEANKKKFCDQSEPVAMSVHAKSSKRTGAKFNGNCNYCKAYGHKQSDCRKLKAKKKEENGHAHTAKAADTDTDEFVMVADVDDVIAL